MTCAVVEHQDGTERHYTNVEEAALSMTRNRCCVKLRLIDGFEKIIKSGVSVKLVDDNWITERACSFLTPN